MESFIASLKKWEIISVAVFMTALSCFPANPKPNIIFFLVDDMGWMDCSVYGSKYYETPNIDRLAKRGMRFTNAYTAHPLCSPTRASIMTGRFPSRFDLLSADGHLSPNPDAILMADKAEPWKKMIDPISRTFMPLDEITIPEMLKKAGYVTAHIGKWHLGHDPYNPINQGFEINIGGGAYPGPPSYFSPYKISTLPDGPDKEYITDRLTQEALKYIKSHKDATFYLNMWHYAVHAPFQGKLPMIEKYANKADPRGKQKCPIMGAMIESMDQSLGLILDELDSLHLTNNTLFIFFSDNGGNFYNLVDGTEPTNNYPLKFGKGNIHEGGIRVPCIVSWPGKIPENKVSDALVSSVDFFPTIMDVAGVREKPKNELDGISLTPLLLHNKPLKRDAIFASFVQYSPVPDNTPSTAVMYKNWKLIRVFGEGENRKPAYELYNLEQDISEEHNLAGDHANLVKKLEKLIEEHLKRTKSLIPIPNPAYDPTAKSPMGIKKDFPVDKYPCY